MSLIVCRPLVDISTLIGVWMYVSASAGIFVACAKPRGYRRSSSPTRPASTGPMSAIWSVAVAIRPSVSLIGLPRR